MPGQPSLSPQSSCATRAVIGSVPAIALDMDMTLVDERLADAGKLARLAKQGRKVGAVVINRRGVQMRAIRNTADDSVTHFRPAPAGHHPALDRKINRLNSSL